MLPQIIDKTGATILSLPGPHEARPVLCGGVCMLAYCPMSKRHIFRVSLWLAACWGCSGTESTGNPSAGGTSSNGGSPTGGAVNGGATAMGGSTGGTSSNAGGTANTGGAQATGGAVATGGMPATGGAPATGGTRATGGQSSLGGTASTGGTRTTGGNSATGGMAPTGGAKATGGASVTGGSSSAGGASGATGCGMTNYPAPCSTSGSPCSMNVNGTTRTYYVKLPSNYNASQAYPLVFEFHYLGGTAEQIFNDSIYNVRPNFANAIYVIPQGLPIWHE